MSNISETPFHSSLRDVGDSINKFAGSELIATGKLYASASLDDATDEDNELLRNEYKLKTMIDTHKSLDIGTNPTRTGNMQISKFMGITRCRVDLRSRTYYKNIMARLSMWTKCKIFFSMITLDSENPSIVAPVADSMWVHGPIGESLEVLDTGIEQICDLFKALLCRTSMYPVLVCGSKWMREQNLLTVLVLLVLRVPVEHISADFVSCVQNLQIDPSQFKSKAEAELVRAIVETKAQWVGAIKNHLDEKYGGVDEYFTRGGVTLQEMDSFREALQAPGLKIELDVKNRHKTADDLQ
ncbi:hypothetical protein QM012_002555 [Aureobasidium pullulans]|uniref:Uncharacterized protein n=1 Tax=Aureobasidium pullulans TaxID=5580 RepID=A0ABR0TAH2_AURPU